MKIIISFQLVSGLLIAVLSILCITGASVSDTINDEDSGSSTTLVNAASMDVASNIYGINPTAVEVMVESASTSGSASDNLMAASTDTINPTATLTESAMQATITTPEFTTYGGSEPIEMATNPSCARTIRPGKAQGKSVGEYNVAFNLIFNKEYPCSFSNRGLISDVAHIFINDVIALLYSICQLDFSGCEGVLLETISPGSVVISGIAVSDNVKMLSNAEDFYNELADPKIYVNITLPEDSYPLGAHLLTAKVTYVNPYGETVVHDRCGGCYNGGSCNGICHCISNCNGPQCKSCKIPTALVITLSVVGTLCMMTLLASICYMTRTSTLYLERKALSNMFGGFGAAYQTEKPLNLPYSIMNQPYKNYSTRFPTGYTSSSGAYTGRHYT